MRKRNLVFAIGLVVAAVAATVVILYLTQNRKDDVFEEGPPLAIVVISDEHIAANQRLDPLVKRGALKEVRIPIELLEDGAITDLDDLAGTITAAPIRRNEQILIAWLTVD